MEQRVTVLKEPARHRTQVHDFTDNVLLPSYKEVENSVTDYEDHYLSEEMYVLYELSNTS